MASTAAFYINLDTRTDRREHMEAQLARIGVAAERFSAVTPAQVDSADLALAKRHALSPGELACSRSHQRIWALLLERGLDGALIFEDDALLSCALRDVFATPDLHQRFDEIHFEARRKLVRLGAPINIAGHSFRRLMSPILGTCAYYISADLAAALLQRPDLDRYALDKLLFGRRAGLIYDARIYQSVPSLAAQLTIYSDGTSSIAQSDLSAHRRVHPIGRPPRSLASRAVAIRTGLSYWRRAILAFGPTGDLFRSRNIDVPLAEDIAEQL